MCWLAYLLKTGRSVHPDAAFGDSVRELLNPVLQGVMLACVMAARKWGRGSPPVKAASMATTTSTVS